ncbi:unnamed protein product [Gadus morhua 'NCC']|jgi:hypothetical protein
MPREASNPTETRIPAGRTGPTAPATRGATLAATTATTMATCSPDLGHAASRPSTAQEVRSRGFEPRKRLAHLNGCCSGPEPPHRRLIQMKSPPPPPAPPVPGAAVHQISRPLTPRCGPIGRQHQDRKCAGRKTRTSVSRERPVSVYRLCRIFIGSSWRRGGVGWWAVEPFQVHAGIRRTPLSKLSRRGLMLFGDAAWRSEGLGSL